MTRAISAHFFGKTACTSSAIVPLFGPVPLSQHSDVIRLLSHVSRTSCLCTATLANRQISRGFLILSFLCALASLREILASLVAAAPRCYLVFKSPRLCDLPVQFLFLCALATLREIFCPVVGARPPCGRVLQIRFCPRRCLSL